MNKIEIILKFQNENKEGIKEYESTIRSNYTPCDTASIFDCINYLNGKAKRVKESLECLNKLCENESIDGFTGSFTIKSGRVIFTRSDSTVIDELEINDIDDLEFTTRFINSFNYV